MKVTYFALVSLCLHSVPALFASADGKKPASSQDSFESASRMEKVSISSNLTQNQHLNQQQHRNLALGNIGEDYLRKIRTFTPLSDTDQRFGDRVAASANARVIAITGSELLPPNSKDNAGDSVLWRGYVEIQNLDTNTRSYIRSDTSEYDPPRLDVAMNGDGTKVAVAEVHAVSTKDDGNGTNPNPISSVKVYSLDEEGGEEASSPWLMVGSPIPIGIAGELPGLRLAFNDSGGTLVVGSRNFNNGFGRTVVYQLSRDGDEYNERNVVNGQKEDDHEGSSVSITSDGTYYASGATGFDAIGPDEATVKPNRGGVRIFSFATNEQVGNVILGEEEGDASGFSVSLVKMTQTRLVVAIGAILNDPSLDKINAGHVRVYAFTIDGEEENWQQVGSDIDGENGTYLNFEENTFHISDRYGFASQLSKDGKRLAVGAPYHYGPGSRDAGYYHGKVQLFEFHMQKNCPEDDENDGKWVQIASDIVGASKDSNTGHSLALDTTGKTIVVGGPSETGGSVLVYYQDEYSSQPSAGPSLEPSVAPSQVPTVFHSSSPSNIPSVRRSEPPSNIPSLKPSASPSSTPTLTPSIQPSIIPSQAPSQKPSSLPSSTPTFKPSASPSSTPTLTPSFQPTIIPSKAPSQEPSTFEGRTFRIISTSPQFSNLAGSNNDQSWCLEAKLSVADPSSSILRVRPCSHSRARVQSWYLLADGKLSLRNENPGTFCVKGEARTLSLQSCSSVLETSSISFTSLDETISGAIILSRSGKELYFGTSTDKIFSRVKLFTRQAINPSKESWRLEYIPAPVYSSVPTSTPSTSPSLVPSAPPSTSPSSVPSNAPNRVFRSYKYCLDLETDGVPFRDAVSGSPIQFQIFKGNRKIYEAAFDGKPSQGNDDRTSWSCLTLDEANLPYDGENNAIVPSDWDNTSFKVVTGGNDGLLIDRFRKETFGSTNEVQYWGANNDYGWCLSTDPNDVNGSFSGSVSGCHVCIQLYANDDWKIC